jgi:dihydroflavonol-4-reductase
MRTLVTGSTGFLGGHLLAELQGRREGSRLRVLVRRPEQAHALESRGVEIVPGSVTVAADVARAVAGVDRIYHLAGLVSRARGDAHRMYEVHVEGTRLLAEAARAAGVRRMVLLSTSGTVAVSERADEMPDETTATPLDIIARWPYYASKLYQEETARRACGDAVELVMVNPSLLLGPGDDRLSSTRDVLAFLAGDVVLTPSGGLSFVDVRDVAAALPAAMERGRPGERYLMGGHNCSFAEFFGRLGRLAKVAAPRLRPPGKWTLLAAQAQAALYRKLGRTPRVEPDSVEMARYFWYVRSDRAREELGFSPRDATETLNDTVKYLRAHFLGGGALGAAAAR